MPDYVNCFDHGYDLKYNLLKEVQKDTMQYVYTCGVFNYMGSIFKGVIDIEKINKRNENTLCEWIGIKVVELGDDYLKAVMPIDHRTVQPLRIVNGGAYCVLAESIGSTAANLCLDRDQFVAVGLDINANHIRSAHEGSGNVYGVAKPIHLGRTTQVWEIRITDEQDKLCCISRLTMAVIALQKDERNFNPPKV